MKNTFSANMTKKVERKGFFVENLGFRLVAKNKKGAIRFYVCESKYNAHIEGPDSDHFNFPISGYARFDEILTDAVLSLNTGRAVFS